MSTPRMYGDRAALYDLIYHDKDYEGEVVRLVEILEAESVGAGARVLDTACGTGEHLKRLSDHYDVAGLDLSGDMLAIARRKAPDVPFRRADLADFRVDAPFDAVLCLFSSIGYLLGEDRLRAAATSFARALRPDGLLVVEPWIDPEDFRAGTVHLHTHVADGLAIARAAHSVVRGERSIIEFQWLVARDGEGVEHFVEAHECWLCPRARMERIFEEAGFEVRFEENGLMRGRGLLLGRRRKRGHGPGGDA